jgi:hypothetical protein
MVEHDQIEGPRDRIQIAFYEPDPIRKVPARFDERIYAEEIPISGDSEIEKQPSGSAADVQNARF